MAATFTLVSRIRGYHVYKDIWNLSLGESVRCERKDRNSQDPYAAAQSLGLEQLFDILTSGLWSFVTLTPRNSQFGKEVWLSRLIIK